MVNTAAAYWNIARVRIPALRFQNIAAAEVRVPIGIVLKNSAFITGIVCLAHDGLP